MIILERPMCGSEHKTRAVIIVIINCQNVLSVGGSGGDDKMFEQNHPLSAMKMIATITNATFRLFTRIVDIHITFHPLQRIATVVLSNYARAYR